MLRTIETVGEGFKLVTAMPVAERPAIEIIERAERPIIKIGGKAEMRLELEKLIAGFPIRCARPGGRVDYLEKWAGLRRGGGLKMIAPKGKRRK